MKYLIFSLLCLFLISCKKDNILEIVSTGEKVELDASPYVVGDTVILQKSSFPNSTWSMDINWVFLTDTTTVYTFNDSTTLFTWYREAVIVQ